MKKKAIAIITARGGSKRIPKKNIKEFCGRPIIAYSIDAALESKIFDEVMVSTDSQEIAEIAKKYGAEVPFYRSAETSNDTATTADVLLEVLDTYKKNGTGIFIYVLHISNSTVCDGWKIAESYEGYGGEKATRDNACGQIFLSATKRICRKQSWIYGICA